jgi:membrane-associated phospholipid phosphatase
MRNTTYLLAALIFAATPVQSKNKIEPEAGSWHTWIVPDVKAYRSPAPPDHAASLQEAKDLEALAANRDATILAEIEFWNAGSPAYRWIQFAQQEVNAHALGGPAATRAMSLVAASLNDAIIAAWDSKYIYNRPRPSQIDNHLHPAVAVPDSPSYPSDFAAAAAVSAAVLDYLFPDDKAAIDTMAARAADSRPLAGVEFPSDVSAGTTLGNAIGTAAVSRAQNDGFSTLFTGSYPPTPGVWSNANPSFPLAGSWKPWALSSAAQFRLSSPAAYATPDFQQQVLAVKQLARTIDTNHTAWFWQPSFIDPWIDLATRFLSESGYSLDAPKVAQTYALAMIAQHDATLACWDTKYTWLELRPVMADPAITTLFPTPAHPSFPSGHACASGAAGAALGAVFPDWASYFTERAREAGLSTFYAGVHFPSDVDQGLALGQAVAQVVISKSALAQQTETNNEPY